MQLLLVDADPQFLSLLVRVVGTMRPGWMVRTAPDGVTAQAMVRDRMADVIACEVRGEGRGAALLDALRTAAPAAIRVALVSDAARADAIALAQRAHRLLDRPCTGADLVATVERAQALRTMLEDPALQAAVGGMTSLPSPPQVLMALESELADPASTMERMARVIERDPGAAVAVIHMANTTLFRRAQEATTVLDALRSLGTQLVRAVVITHAVTSRLAPPPGLLQLDAWQERSASVAGVARDLARRLARIELQREAFIAGLLHDVGTVVLASGAPDLLRALRARAIAHNEDAITAARALGQPTIAAVGAYLLALWGIPVAIVEAVAASMDPASLPGQDVDAALAVHVADALVDRPGFAPRLIDPALFATRRRGAEVEAWMAAASALRT